MTCSAKMIALNAAMLRDASGWRIVVEFVVIGSGESGWLGARSYYEPSRAEGSLAWRDPQSALQPLAPRRGTLAPAHLVLNGQSRSTQVGGARRSSARRLTIWRPVKQTASQSTPSV